MDQLTSINRAIALVMTATGRQAIMKYHWDSADKKKSRSKRRLKQNVTSLPANFSPVTPLRCCWSRFRRRQQWATRSCWRLSYFRSRGNGIAAARRKTQRTTRGCRWPLWIRQILGRDRGPQPERARGHARIEWSLRPRAHFTCHGQPTTARNPPTPRLTLTMSNGTMAIPWTSLKLVKPLLKRTRWQAREEIERST